MFLTNCIKKSYSFVLFFALVTGVTIAQNSQRIYKGVVDNGSSLSIMVNDGVYAITPYTDQIIETAFVPNDEVNKIKSHAVVLSPTEVSTSLVDEAKELLYKTSGIEVRITKKPFQISYWYNNGLIIAENNGYVKAKDEEDGKQYEKLVFKIDSDEVLYGAGARALGMNRRGHKLQLYNRAHYGYETHSELMNFTMPLVMSSKKYALHFDNAPIGYLDLDSKKENRLTYAAISGRKVYQVIVGDSWVELVNNYTNLTGKQPLPPRWALGNFASRFGYHSEKEARAVVDKFQKEKIPLDAIVLDLYWFGKEIKGTMGNLEFDKDSFPNPKKMIADFTKKGVKTVLITEPFVLTTSKKWKEAVAKQVLAKDSLGKPFVYDFYFGNTGLIDVYKPEGKQWFWDTYVRLKKLGVAGWWGDLGEPEVHPSALIHETGTADEVHNIYGHDWARLLYEGYQKEYATERPFILMRAGYSGSQHFGMIPWSGDVNRTWGGLQSQPEIALQMGMQGMGYMHSDLGGFAGDTQDDELYVRWLQYGVFQPVFRPHGQEEVASEAIFKTDETKELAKKAIQLRYQLLPYNYTLAYKNSRFGTPLMRPIFFEDTTIDSLVSYSKSYFWGDDFLVSPVLEAGLKSQEVYFPAQNNWYDFYTDKKFIGGNYQQVALKKENIPTYVRGGAFIPMIKTIQSTESYDLASFDLHYYNDTQVKKSNGNLYHDDGLTSDAFNQGKYELLNFNAEQRSKSLTIKISDASGKQFSGIDKTITLVVHNIHKKPKRVKKYSYSYHSENKTLHIPVRITADGKVEVKIKF